MVNVKNKYLMLILLLLLLTLGIGTIPFAAAHGNISGTLVYSANVPSIGATELMFTITVGSDPDNGRIHIDGDNTTSVSYPQAASDGLAILSQAFADTNNAGVIDQSTTTPFIRVLKTDGTDITPLTTTEDGAAYAASFSPDERRMAFAYAADDTDGDGVLTMKDTAHLAIKELGKVDPLNPSPRQMASNNRIQVLTKNNDFSVEKPIFLTNDLIVLTGKNVADGTTTVHLYNISNATLTPVAPAGAQTRNPAPSIDSKQIAVEVSTITETYNAIFDIESKSWSRLPSTGMAGSSFAWSINGILAIAMTDGSKWQILIIDGAGQHQLVEIPQPISGLDFSPDGKTLAYMWDYDGRPGNVVAIAAVDGGYGASVTSPDSDVISFAWVPVS